MASDFARIAVLNAEGHSAADIARIVGCSARAVQRWRRRTGHSLGEAQAPLPQSVKRQAALLLEDGCHVAEVARTLGVSFRTVVRWFPDAPRMSRAEVGAYMRMHRTNRAVLG